MFARRNRRPKSAESLKAWECLDGGDLPGAIRQLRAGGEDAPAGDVALVVERAATMAGFDDLKAAAGALAGSPADAEALYRFAYACVERGLPFLAVPPLREVLRQHPGALGPLRELVSAYEREGRHREAVDALLAHESGLADWPDRYLLVFNALMAGDLPLARGRHAGLADPEDPMWRPAQARQRRMLERAASAERISPLDGTDLRGWSYVAGGTVLGTLSPYGFTAGMTGRYAWLQDTHEQCLRGLLRLRAAVEAARLSPRSVSLLPDRSSRILGMAAAGLFGLPAEPFSPGREDTLVIAYDLNALAGTDEGPALLGQLHERTPGQVLHEHASSWTDTPVVTPDSVCLFQQSVVAPWEARLGQVADGVVEKTAPDDRPAAEIAADITAAAPTLDEGDGDTPADPDEAFGAFVTAVRDTWLRGPRDRVHAPSAVRSSRFV